MKTYSFEDGKYKVIRSEKDAAIVSILRHDETWNSALELFQFNKMFHAMLNYIDKLEEVK